MIKSIPGVNQNGEGEFFCTLISMSLCQHKLTIRPIKENKTEKLKSKTQVNIGNTIKGYHSILVV